MKTLLATLIVLSALGLASQLDANPAEHPKRMVSGKTVDLTPLMNWWTKREGDRPLRAWVRVTGSVVGTNALGWTVEGTVESPRPPESSDQQTNTPAGSSVRIVLRNPPLADLLAFHQLTEQIQFLKQERSRIAYDADYAGKALQQLSQRRVYGKMYSRLAEDEVNQWRAAEQDAKDRLSALDERLKALDAQLEDYPDKDRYQVDCFALRLGEQLRGVPIYDHGSVLTQ